MSGRIAIVGMEAVFGVDEGLDAFDCTIFDGIRHSSTRASDRPKKVRTGSRPERRQGYFRLLDGTGPVSPAALLRTVIDGARRNTISRPAENVWSATALIVVSDCDVSAPPVDPKRFHREGSLPLALLRTRDLLRKREADAVMIAAVQMGDPAKAAARSGAGQKSETPAVSPGSGPATTALSMGQGAGAVLLKPFVRARQDRDRIYAVIDAFVFAPNELAPGTLPPARDVADVCRKAFDMAGVGPGQIGYLELLENGLVSQDHNAMKGLSGAYAKARNGLTCALGSASANLGRDFGAGGLAGLIKTALCLYHRYIPAVPGRTGPAAGRGWDASPFYVTTESRTWFPARGIQKRVAALNGCSTNGTAHLILSEDSRRRTRQNRYLVGVSPYVFPIAGDRAGDLIQRLQALGRTLQNTVDLRRAAREYVSDFDKRSQAPYALVIVGHTREELLREIQFMRKGLPAACEKGGDARTPKGSYFTAAPLGRDGKVAFVYPGVGSAYVGLGHALFHLFPEIYDQFSKMVPDMAGVLKEKKIYPRSREPLTGDDIWQLELQLRKDMITVSECGMGFFALYTLILKNVFKVVPDCALGYSMGEAGMMAALDVWVDPGQLSGRLNSSPVFRDRLNGEFGAVREYWKQNRLDTDSNEIGWNCYTLQAAPSTVSEVVKNEEKAFLTIVNSPAEVLIAGDPAACARVIEKIGCKHYAMGLPLVIHCDPARLEYDRLVDLHTLPVRRNPGMKFYSSSCYKAVPIRSKAVAHSIAEAFCVPVDFPRLINQVYADGARIFIEIGARKFCSNLIDKILQGKAHHALAVNVKGVKDQISVVRVLAQLASHRVEVDLSPLV
ncbi:MAG: type I polyketide synthase [Desulfobacterales bacterium]|nr:type I polyketide synthase [Desulfobacterales bacterium]